MKYYLAVDIGASSGRHILMHLEDNKLCFEEIHRFENGYKETDGVFCWDIAHLEEEVKNGIRKCKEIGKIPHSVAIDTWGVDYVLLDENKDIIHPVYSYRDNQTIDLIEESEKVLSYEEIYSRCGIQKMSFNTIYQLYRDNKNGRLQKAEYLLMLPSYLSYALTGVMKNEYTDASTSSVVNANTKQWDMEIIERFGFPKKLFDKLWLPGSLVGEFSKATQEYVGFSSKVLLCPSHDTASAVAGCPLGDDDLYVSSGTWSLIGTEIKDPILTKQSEKANFTNEGGICYRYRYLKNYMGMWLFQNIRKNLDKKYTYDEMMNMAKGSKVIEYFDVNDESLLSPNNMIDAIDKLLGGNKMPLGDLLNCVYHSLAKSYENAVKEIEANIGKKIERIFIVGGGSKDTYLNSLSGKYTGKKILTGISEATAVGNLISQLMADENITLEEGRKIIYNSMDIKEEA